MKDEAGAVFTITPPFVSRPMGSCCIAAYGFLVAERSRFFPSLAPVKWTSPKSRLSFILGVPPVRLGRHNPWSIATLRQSLARALLRQLAGCPFCGAPFL